MNQNIMAEEKLTIAKRLASFKRSHFLLLKIIAVVIGSAIMYLSFVYFLFDFVLFVLLLLCLAVIMPNQSPVNFILDWWWFASGIYFYSLFRGYIDNFSPWLYNDVIINLERSIFGLIPSEKLQTVLHATTNFYWYDHVAYYFYISFFVFSYIVGYFIWSQSRQMFRIYALGFLTLLVLGLLIYFFFPLVPPWMASEQGKIDVVRLLMPMTQIVSLGRIDLLYIYRHFSPNLVAAMPSLHVAFTFYSCLMLTYVFGKKSLPLMIIPVGISFAVVYFAEHYVLDVAAGFLVAYISYLIAKKLIVKLKFVQKVENLATVTHLDNIRRVD